MASLSVQTLITYQEEFTTLDDLARNQYSPMLWRGVKGDPSHVVQTHLVRGEDDKPLLRRGVFRTAGQ